MRISRIAPILVFILASCSPVITSVPSASLTPTLTSTPALTSTPTLTVTLIPKLTFMPTHELYPVSTLVSPDGTKRIQSYDWKTFDVVTTDGAVLWSFTYDINKFGADVALFMYEAGYVPKFWSPDGKYIYLTSLHGQDGSTKFFGNVFIDGKGVFRFDTETGKLDEIVPEILAGYYAFSFSPDGKQLAYTNQTETPVTIKLRNLDTQKEQILLTTETEVLEIGSFGWSPQKNKLIFTTLEIVEDNKRIYSISVLDLNSLKVQKIIKNFDEYLNFKTWNEQGQVFYRDNKTYDGNPWQLNLDSQELFPLATQTPWPLRTPTPKP
jgi:dipeptidyl aminopeptidase/acylaminoacyl peptidase